MTVLWAVDWTSSEVVITNERVKDKGERVRIVVWWRREERLEYYKEATHSGPTKRVGVSGDKGNVRSGVDVRVVCAAHWCLVLIMVCQMYQW